MSPLKPLSVFLTLVVLALPARAKTGPDDVTIKNEKISVGLSLTPEPRITSFARTGEPSLLLNDPGYERTGIRFVALEEKDGKQTGYSFGGKSQYIHKDGSAFESVLDDKGQVKLTVWLELPSAGSRAVVHCKLTNNAQTTRKLALWGIAAVEPKGWILSTISRGIENGAWITGRFIKFFMSDSNEPALKMGRDAMAFDLSLWRREASPKYGTRTNEGWVAVARPDLKALLLVLLPYESSDRYPDDDCNVTMWFGTTPSKVPYAEAEWMSPWREVAAGKSLEWEFALEARDLPAMENLTPDTLMNAVRNPQKLTPETAGPAGVWRLSMDGPLLKDSFQRVTEVYAPDGTLIAKAPIWYDAPVWSEQGITWLGDTLLEADAKAIPEWSGTGRSWGVKFSAATRGAYADAALLREGDEAGGFSLFVAGGKVHAALWNGAEGCEVSAPLSAEPVQNVRAWIEDKRLKLQVNDKEIATTNISFALPSPARRLALGRDSTQPKGLNLPVVPKFLGSFREISITP